MVLSMLAAPFIIERSEHIVRHVSGADWMRARDGAAQHRGAVDGRRSQHVVVCGYGRSGQNLARLLDTKASAFIALDLDPSASRKPRRGRARGLRRCRAARSAGRGGFVARAGAGGHFADSALALRILAHVRELRPGLPVVVRTLDDTDIDRLREAGAAEVVAEIMEGSLMLASHALMLLGVPLNRVLRRIRETREQRYSLLRGFFHGATDAAEDAAHAAQKLLHSVLILPARRRSARRWASSASRGSTWRSRRCAAQYSQAQAPQPDARIEAGDVLVLLGAEQDFAAAEMKLMQG